MDIEAGAITEIFFIKKMINIYNDNSAFMRQVPDSSVHLVVTSPPYPMIQMWDECFIKQNISVNFLSIHHYILKPAWEQSYNKLINGGILAINIGDATRKFNNQFQLFPNHARVINDCFQIGFTVLPYILWKKPTNKPNAFLGSGMLPTNGYVTLDCEFILLFRKGELRKFKPKDANRYDSKFTQEERNKWFSQIWEIKGTRQTKKDVPGRTGAFPSEIPHRLIKMFSVKGDTVLDPFCGLGTVLEVAEKLERNSIGYEINGDLMPFLVNKFNLAPFIKGTLNETDN